MSPMAPTKPSPSDEPAVRPGSGKTTGGMLSCGLTSGLLQAGIFNPWDRALYLSIKDGRAFLHVDNWRSPFSGLMQTIVQRALSAGLYFPLEELYRSSLYRLLEAEGKGSPQKSLLTIMAGILSGITSGVIMNPISAVKYHYWGTPTGKENFFSTSADMWRRGGLRTFLVGTGATVNRDLVFGGVYAFMRHEFLPAAQNSDRGGSSEGDGDKGGAPNGRGMSRIAAPGPGFFVNLVAACSATIISSPWNYVRNVHYATQRGAPPMSAAAILRDLWAESLLEREKGGGAVFSQLRFLQTKLRIGWGTVSSDLSSSFLLFTHSSCLTQLTLCSTTPHPPFTIPQARVGCGMAFGARFYDWCSQK